jgi:hypothetical protein
LSIQLPAPLAQPLRTDGLAAAKVMLDLTVYLQGPSLAELDFLVDWYARTAPAGRLRKFKLAEQPNWLDLSLPHPTACDADAAMTPAPLPFLASVRERVSDGRAFSVGVWDGRPIDDQEGSWSFNCTRVQLAERGSFAFVRILVPVLTDPAVLSRAAAALAQNVEFLSGHGGLAFTYDPWLKPAAMDYIYARARRFWGVDVEDLNVTLPLTRRGIKGVAWLTLIGKPWLTPPFAERLQTAGDVVCDHHRHGVVLMAGAAPAVGDRHRPDGSLDVYFELARALAPTYLQTHPDFSGERFAQHNNTLGWVRRFLEPHGWT